MDILVLDAPMKFIHGKMVEQGAKEWSRYLASEFNPVGRGSLYSEHYDVEVGLKVYLYSATITLECVGDSKGYLKVVKATDTDVMTYHKMMEEGKLLEEKITFVPVYKFQYINGKEHHDVERFMQVEKEKQEFKDYFHRWTELISDNHLEKTTKTIVQVECEKVAEAIQSLHLGHTINPDMKNFLPAVENLEKPIVQDFTEEAFTSQYKNLTTEQKEILAKALSSESVYFIDTHKSSEQSLSDSSEIMQMITEIAQYSVNTKQKVLVVAPTTQAVDVILKEVEKGCKIESMHLQNVINEDQLSKYSLEYKVKNMKDEILARLDEEAIKYSKYKDELDQMTAECELYKKADQTLTLSQDILELLKELGKEQEANHEEAYELGMKGMEYVEDLDKYYAIDPEVHEVYSNIKSVLGEDEHLYEEIVWMKSNEANIHYPTYKELIIKYSDQVQEFEEKIAAYKYQMNEINHNDENYKALEARLLELRRQYLKTEALKQVDIHNEIQSDESVVEEIKALEAQIVKLDKQKKKFETGIISTRHLDELKVKVYELKEQVEAYILEYQHVLSKVCTAEEVTKADVIKIFKRMQKIEALFGEEGQYAMYLEGLDEYFALEVVVKKNNELVKQQEINQSKLNQLLKKEQELMSLLSTKLGEAEFKEFMKVVPEGELLSKQILAEPLSEESKEALDQFKQVVHERVSKLEEYKDKVSFYEELAKLKEDWWKALAEKKDFLMGYLTKQIQLVGATCKELEEHQDKDLVKESFDYVIVTRAHQVPGLELVIPIIKGKKVILIGDATSKDVSLFARLYERCPKESKSLLEI